MKACRLGLILLGNTLMSFSYAFLTVPLKIVNGGITSFSLVLSGVTGADTALIVDIITVLLLVLCYFCLGREYFFGSMIGGICYMVTFSGFHSMGICLMPNRPLAVFVAAVLVGTGYYLCISQHSTGVSFDTLAIILHRWNPRIRVAAAMFVINLAVLALGSVYYGIQSVLFGIAFTAVQSLTLDILLRTVKIRCA